MTKLDPFKRNRMYNLVFTQILPEHEEELRARSRGELLKALHLQLKDGKVIYFVSKTFTSSIAHTRTSRLVLHL